MPSVRLMIHRAERFPSVVKLRMEGEPMEVRYVREWTCHMTSGPFNEFDYCSECGGLLARWIDYQATTGYCPNCGARVVE